MRESKILRFILFLMCFLVLPSESPAQAISGVKQTAVSSSFYAGYQDLFSPLINPALHNRNTAPEAAFYYNPFPFGLRELASYGGGYAFSNYGTRFTISLSSYGYELFRQSSATISAARTIEGVNIGAALQIAHLNIARYGSSIKPLLHFGVQYEPLKNLLIGSSFHNLINTSWGDTKDQIGQSIGLGLQYLESDFLIFSYALRKDTGYDVEQVMGIETIPIEFLKLLGGINVTTRTYSTGLTILYSSIHADYAVAIHPVLGLSHQFGIGYSFE